MNETESKIQAGIEPVAAQGKLPAFAAFAGLAALSVCLILGCWDAAFTGRDDDRYVVRHPIVSGQQSVFSAFTDNSLELYIPTVVVSYRLDRLLFHELKSTSLGTWAPGCRVMSLFYHILAGFILWRWVLPKLGFGSIASSFIAGIFLVHPSQCEAVCWIAERKTVLGGLFGAATMALYFRWAESSGKRMGVLFFATTAAFALALMSKITMLGLLPVLVCWEILVAKKRETIDYGRAALRLCALMPVALILLYVNWESAKDQFGIRMGDNIFQSLLTDVEILARYLAVLIWPPMSSPYYEMTPITSIFSARFLIAAAGFFGPVLLTLWLPKSSDERRKVAFGWLWFVGAMSLALNLAAQPEYMHDRYMYFSLPGVALVIVIALKGFVERLSLPISNSLAGGAVAISCLILALIAVDVGKDWGSEILTFERSVRKQPDSTFSQGYLGTTLGVAANVIEDKRGDHDQARKFREQAAMHLKTACFTPDANYNIRRAQFWVAQALVLQKLGHIDEARAVLQKLPQHAQAQHWQSPGDLIFLKKGEDMLREMKDQ